MSRYVTVRVTQADIDVGKRRTTDRCPLALALRAAGYPLAKVGGWSWSAGEAIVPRAELTNRAALFVTRFDKGKPVQPATFRLPLP